MVKDGRSVWMIWWLHHFWNKIWWLIWDVETSTQLLLGQSLISWRFVRRTTVRYMTTSSTRPLSVAPDMSPQVCSKIAIVSHRFVQNPSWAIGLIFGWCSFHFWIFQCCTFECFFSAKQGTQNVQSFLGHLHQRRHKLESVPSILMFLTFPFWYWPNMQWFGHSCLPIEVDGEFPIKRYREYLQRHSL